MEIIFTALSPKLSVMLFPSLYSTSAILVKLTNKKEPCKRNIICNIQTSRWLNKKTWDEV